MTSSIERRHVLVVLVAVLAAVVAIAAGGAQATMPGQNGLIAFSAEVNGFNQVFTIAPDGTGLEQITNVGGESEAVAPDWSPDGTQIAFERGFGYPHAGVHTMNPDGGDVHAITPNRKLLFEGNPSYSPDGRKIVQAREIHFKADVPDPRDRGDIVVENLDGTGQRVVSPRLHIGGSNPTHYDDPNFSPDGKWITYIYTKQEHVLQAVMAVRPDGTGLHRLTPFSSEVAIKHDWSPDGKLILVTTNADFVRPRESANLVVIRPDGSGAQQLTHFKGGKRNAFAGSFSPDGKQIVFRYEQGEKYALAVIDRDGTNMRLITKLSDFRPRFIDWGSHQ